MAKSDSGCQNDTQRTRDKLAAESGVSPSTIVRDAHFSTGVDFIGEVLGEAEKQHLLSGKSDWKKGEVVKLGQLVKKDPERAISAVHLWKQEGKKAFLERISPQASRGVQKISAEIDAETYRWLVEYAKLHGTSISNLVHVFLRELRAKICKN
jgi:hypothetical protein